MAGTLTNLPLSQQFDKTTGAFLAGGRLYFYTANTTTPQSAYKDTGLLLAHPNPIELDAAGRVPSFYLADGSIRVRLEDKDGVVQFDEANLLVIGPSGGGGGGGTTVDATAIFQTGDTLWVEASGTRSGWVRDNARTIGSATSGASERANADCQALFLFGWAAGWAVGGGSGASAAADWAANKQITLPDKRGCTPGGLDDMGNTAAGRYVGAPVVSGSVTTAGAILGENLHSLNLSETPAHPHTIDPAGTDLLDKQGTTATTLTGGGTYIQLNGSAASLTNLTGTTVGASTTAAAGGGNAHNTVQRTVLGTFYRKL